MDSISAQTAVYRTEMIKSSTDLEGLTVLTSDIPDLYPSPGIGYWASSHSPAFISSSENFSVQIFFCNAHTGDGNGALLIGRSRMSAHRQL